MERRLAADTKIIKRKILHWAYHKAHMHCHEINPGIQAEKYVSQSLS